MDAALHFDAVITPNRSLPKTGFKVLMIALVLINLVVGGFFLAIGALPIPIFLGLDVLGVLIAFRASYRSARRAERVQVSADEVRVLHETEGTGKVVWRAPTAFARVAIEKAGEHQSRVVLAASGRRWQVGGALSPEERIELGQALEAAIRAARLERYPG